LALLRGRVEKGDGRSSEKRQSSIQSIKRGRSAVKGADGISLAGYREE